jgi:hypothetical protein
VGGGVALAAIEPFFSESVKKRMDAIEKICEANPYLTAILLRYDPLYFDPPI